MYMRSAHFWHITLRRMAILYRRFGTTCRSHLQGSSSRSDFLTFEMGSIGSETSVQNCHSTQSNIPEKRRSHRRVYCLELYIRCLRQILVILRRLLWVGTAVVWVSACDVNAGNVMYFILLSVLNWRQGWNVNFCGTPTPTVNCSSVLQALVWFRYCARSASERRLGNKFHRQEELGLELEARLLCDTVFT